MKRILILLVLISNLVLGQIRTVTTTGGTTGTYIKFSGTSTASNALAKDSSSIFTLGSTRLLARNFTFVDGNQGAAKVLTSDGSGNATWQAPATSGTVTSIATGNGITGGTITTTGTLGLSGATGDIGSFSGTNTYSAIPAVAAGSYLRSAGTSTLPVWSTLVLPNSATANYVPYATSTNTWGESANMIFDGTAFVLGGGGVVSTELFGINKSQNSGTRAFVTNSNAGTGSYSEVLFRNGTYSQIIGMAGTGYTTGTYDVQNGGYMVCNGIGGLSVGSTHASGVTRFYSGGTAERARFDSTGNLLLGGATVTLNASQLLLNGAGHVYAQMNVGNGSYEGSFLFSRNTVLKYQFGMGAAATANFVIYDYAVSRYLFYGVGGNVGLGGISTTPTARLQLPAGSATASTSPLKFTDGTPLSSPESGAVEPSTDKLQYTTATGTTRKTFDLLSYRGITALRTLDGSDELVNCTSGTFTVTLPTAVGFTGQYTVKNIGTGIITLATTSSQTIDGYASATLVLNQYDSYTLRSDNANWIIIK